MASTCGYRPRGSATPRAARAPDDDGIGCPIRTGGWGVTRRRVTVATRARPLAARAPTAASSPSVSTLTIAGTTGTSMVASSPDSAAAAAAAAFWATTFTTRAAVTRSGFQGRGPCAPYAPRRHKTPTAHLGDIRAAAAEREHAPLARGRRVVVLPHLGGLERVRLAPGHDEDGAARQDGGGRNHSDESNRRTSSSETASRLRSRISATSRARFSSATAKRMSPAWGGGRREEASNATHTLRSLSSPPAHTVPMYHRPLDTGATRPQPPQNKKRSPHGGTRATRRRHPGGQTFLHWLPTGIMAPLAGQL